MAADGQSTDERRVLLHEIPLGWCRNGTGVREIERVEGPGGEMRWEQTVSISKSPTDLAKRWKKSAVLIVFYNRADELVLLRVTV